MAYKKAAFQLPFGVLNIAREPVDVRYGPYTGIGTASGEVFHVDSPIPTDGNRYEGLTVGIIVAGKVVEYWFESGIADADLVIKTVGGGGGTPPGGAAGNYVSAMPNSMAVPITHGGIVAGTLVSALTNRPMSEIIDEILFPTVLASIKTAASVSATITPAAKKVEVGANVNVSATPSFTQGLIKNGDGTNGPKLVGPATAYKLLIKGAIEATNTDGAPLAVTYVAEYGANLAKVVVDYSAGTGAYKDNKNNTGTNLDASRASGSVNSNSVTYTGVHYMFMGQDQPFATSANLRAMDKVLLNSGDVVPGYLLPVLTTTAHSVVIAFPANKTLASVLLVESSDANVTGTFHKENDVNVILPNGTSVAYNVYKATLTSSYATTVHYKIKIT